MRLLNLSGGIKTLSAAAIAASTFSAQASSPCLALTTFDSCCSSLLSDPDFALNCPGYSCPGDIISDSRSFNWFISVPIGHTYEAFGRISSPPYDNLECHYHKAVDCGSPLGSAPECIYGEDVTIKVCNHYVFTASFGEHECP